MKVTDLIDKPLYAKASVSNIRRLPTVDSPLAGQVKQGNTVGIVYTWVQRADGIWFEVKGVFPGWVRQDVVTNVGGSTGSGSGVQENPNELLQKLVKTDQSLFENLLIIAEQISRMKGKLNVSTAEATYKRIAEEYNRRQNDLKNSKLINFQTGVQKAWAWLAEKWSSLSGSRVGELTTLSVAIIAAVSIGAAAAVYLFLKPRYDASVRNLKEAKELKGLLEQADPLTAERIRQDLEKQIDDAYNRGLTDGTFGGYGKMLGIGLLVLLALKGADYIKPKSN